MKTKISAVLVLIVLAACSSEQQPAQSDAPFDLLIVNATIYDGSGGPVIEGNIGVRDGEIETLTATADSEATRVVDAAGLVVLPGFIDPHTHADPELFDAELADNLNFQAQGVTTVFIGVDGSGIIDRETRVAQMNEHGIGTNVGWYAGHEPAREAAMGLANRAPSEEELDVMRDFVAAEMEAGALGLSTGLFYIPGSFSETAEVIELAKVAARYGGVYDSHMRDESSYNIGVLGSIRELIAIGEGADIPVHAAHLKALGRDVWGQSGDIIALVEAARERGVSVTADQYPWRASGTRFGSALVPAWVRADSEEAMFERLANPDLIDGIHEEMEGNLWRRGGEDSLLVTGESEWRGQTLGEIADAMGLEPVEAAIEVVRGGNPSIASFNMNPDDINALALQDWVMIGSDGSAGHPRKYASYPKAYRDYVESGLMNMAAYARRSAGLAADFFGLCDRGYIEPGRKADIAIIDTDNFLPMADFENPTELATGVEFLVVNGELAIADGAPTGERSGEVINLQNLECRD